MLNIMLLHVQKEPRLGELPKTAMMFDVKIIKDNSRYSNKNIFLKQKYI